MYKGSLENMRIVCSDYFYIKKSNRGKYNIEYYLKQFNINNYYILKSTNRFRFVDENEFINMINVGYIFFRKDLYSKEYIQGWLDLIKENKMDFRFLDKPFPPRYVFEKIKVIDDI